MATDAFAPDTPGEMLKAEFLAEYGLSQNQHANPVGISPNRIAEIVNKSASHHRRHRPSVGLVFRQQPGILDELAESLRFENGTSQAQAGG